MFCWPCYVMFAGMALYVCLLVYVGLSLFIISGLYVYMVVCVVYVYNLTWGGPKKWQKQGRAKWVLSCFCHVIKKSHGNFRTAPLSLNCFGRFSLNSALFIHSPCQTGSQPISGWLYTLHFDMFFKYVHTSYSIINTNVFTLMIYSIMLAPLFILGITGFCLTNKYNFHTVKYISL